MKLVEVRTERDFESLAPAWNDLLQQSASNTIFLTWEWVRSWWTSYGSPDSLRILTFPDENGILRGIVPLWQRSMKRYGQTVSVLALIGDTSCDSDYLDFIIAAGYEQPVMDAFREWADSEFRRGTVLLLNEVPDTSLNLALCSEGAEIRTESDIPCGTVALPDSWDMYLGKLKPRFRTKVRSTLRNLENNAAVTFHFCHTRKQITELLPRLFDLHARRWATEGKPGVFGWDRKRDFYQTLSPLLLDRGWLRFSWMEWNGHVVACQYGFAYNGVYFHLQEGYEPASEHLSIGIGLRAWSIRTLLSEGIREYDFLSGIGRHKTDWGAGTKLSKQVQIARRTLRNLIFCHGPEWETGLRESVRRMLPEAVLRLRERRPPVASGDNWMRQASARAYYALGMSAVLRPFRHRYQIRGKRCERRTEPAARILYYHRVNDDNDLFFPSMPTAVFEQQMEFLARNYKVVSLASALDRLANNSPEPVLAITFDDGYQDNYRNAYPILQRYGLPATIFLTTGAIDSREPLWFEQLAEAAATTDLEFIDLDIDIPRRFWFRTQQERAAANGGIFAVLRGLPDSERRRHVARLLQELKPGGTFTRRDRMLTWDEVRLMKRGGLIDFGGHTVNHPFVSKLTGEEAEHEIAACKLRIEDQMQAPVEHFAYPNGREEDISDRSKEVVRRAGYKAAVTTIWGVNYRDTDRMELRRGQPWEQDMPTFAWKLDWYQMSNA